MRKKEYYIVKKTDSENLAEFLCHQVPAAALGRECSTFLEKDPPIACRCETHS